MAWSRLDDNYFTHRKTAPLSKDAKLLDLAGIAYSARELRDGYLSRRDVRVVAAQVDVDDLDKTLRELERAGRWRRATDGHEIHDYLDYNPSRDQVLRERENTARRQQEWRNAHRNGVTNEFSASVSNGVTNGRPVPGPIPGINPVPDTDTVNPPTPLKGGLVDFELKHEAEDWVCAGCGGRQEAGSARRRRKDGSSLCAACSIGRKRPAQRDEGA